MGRMWPLTFETMRHALKMHAATPSPWRANEYVFIGSQGKRAKDNGKLHRRRQNMEAGETGAS